MKYTTRLSARRSEGFTLIELLVVIAIIAILAAILFPVFAQAKMAAKKTADLSNIKQISLGVQMYNNDVDGSFVPLRMGPSNWQTNITSPQVPAGHILVNPYVKNKQVWTAPNDAMLRCDANSTGYGSPVTGGPVSYVFSYNRTQNMVDPTKTDPHSFGIAGYMPTSAAGVPSVSYASSSLNEGQVGAPASTIFIIPSYISWSYWNGLMQHRGDQREYAFGPEDGLSNGLREWPNVTSAAGAWCGSSDGMALGSYGGITNWGFADGHAKAMKRSAIMDRAWVTDFDSAVSTFKKNLLNADERYH